MMYENSGIKEKGVSIDENALLIIIIATSLINFFFTPNPFLRVRTNMSLNNAKHCVKLFLLTPITKEVVNSSTQPHYENLSTKLFN